MKYTNISYEGMKDIGESFVYSPLDKCGDIDGYIYLASSLRNEENTDPWWCESLLNETDKDGVLNPTNFTRVYNGVYDIGDKIVVYDKDEVLKMIEGLQYIYDNM